MHRDLVERYAYGEGPIHRWDPRLKALLTLAYIALLAGASFGGGPAVWLRTGALGAVLAAGLAWSGLRAGPLLIRSLIVLPFAGLVAAGQLFVIVTEEPLVRLPIPPYGFGIAEGGAERAALTVVRAWLSVVATVLLVSTTPMPRLLAALQGLCVPRVLVEILSFLYRYLWVLLGEAERTLLAHALRAPSRRAPRPRAAAGIVAALFVRTTERSERIHMAMRLRGYSGRLPLAEPLRWTREDTGRAALAAALLALAFTLPPLVV